MDSQQRDHIHRTTTTLQIIIGALAMGVLTFAVIAIVVAAGKAADDESGVIGPMALGVAVVSLVAATLVPRILQGNMRRAVAEGRPLASDPRRPIDPALGDVGKLAAVYQTLLIVGAAILEGAAFMNVMAYMLEYNFINLACAAMLLVSLFFKFPTRNGVENWITDELKQVEELRSLEG